MMLEPLQWTENTMCLISANTLPKFRRFHVFITGADNVFVSLVGSLDLGMEDHLATVPPTTQARCQLVSVGLSVKCRNVLPSGQGDGSTTGFSGDCD